MFDYAGRAALGEEAGRLFMRLAGRTFSEEGHANGVGAGDRALNGGHATSDGSPRGRGGIHCLCEFVGPLEEKRVPGRPYRNRPEWTRQELKLPEAERRGAPDWGLPPFNSLSPSCKATGRKPRLGRRRTSRSVRTRTLRTLPNRARMSSSTAPLARSAD